MGKMLLVGSDDLFLFTLAPYFRERSWNVECASGYDMALRLIQDHSFKVIVADISLEDALFAGFELAKFALRYQPLPVVILVADSLNQKLVEICMKEGVAAVIPKPVVLSLLDSLVKSVVAAPIQARSTEVLGSDCLNS